MSVPCQLLRPFDFCRQGGYGVCVFVEYSATLHFGCRVGTSYIDKNCIRNQKLSNTIIPLYYYIELESRFHVYVLVLLHTDGGRSL